MPVNDTPESQGARVIAGQGFHRSQRAESGYSAVQQIMTTDKHVTSWESTLLSELGLKFGM